MRSAARRTWILAALVGAVLFVVAAATLTLLSGGDVTADQSAASADDASPLGDAASDASSRVGPPGPVDDAGLAVGPAPGTDAPEDPALPSGALDPYADAEPVRVRVPAVGIDVALTRLGLEEDHTLQVPSDFDLAGWYVHGPKPGQTGPAVIAGHVDSTTGPAAFYRLREVQSGQAIHVDYDDGRSVRFVARRIEQHAKDAFPTSEVYGDTPAPALRLVTCGGSFDRSSGHYRDNVIVWADPTTG